MVSENVYTHYPPQGGLLEILTGEGGGRVSKPQIG